MRDTHPNGNRILHRIFNKRLIPIALLILLFNLCFLPVVSEIDGIARAYSYRALQDMTSQTTTELHSRLNRDLDQLELVADILSGCSALDGEPARDLLRSVQNCTEVEQAEILLSDGRTVTEGSGVLQNAELSFREEVKKAPCCASVREIPADSGKRYIVQTAPVTRGGETVGILCGVLSLETFSRRYSPDSGETVQFFVISGQTGDYLLDTRQRVLGNLYQDPFPEIKVISGNTQEEMQKDLIAGQTGAIEYLVKENGNSFFLYYAPVGVDDWMILLTFPHEYIFQTANHIQSILYRMIAIEIVLFLAYLTWVMVRNYRQTARQEQQIARMANQLDIQQTLFSAHNDPSCIQTALGRVAAVLTAEKTFLVSKMAHREIYVWPRRDPNRSDDFDLRTLQRDLPRAAEAFLAGGSLFLDTRQRAFRPHPTDQKLLQTQNVTSLMAVPIFNAKQELIGVLGALNMEQKWSETGLLEGLAHNFMMTLENIRSYQIIERMGTIDALTGLQNRNSYQRTLVERKDDIQGCVYLDANGLHELNNRFGHAAGDAMLQAVGEGLRGIFGPEETYRIGGDEFVVLCLRTTRGEAENLLHRLRAQIEGQGYHVSSGLAWRESGQAVNQVVTLAEERMYADKQRYYESLGDPSRQMR